MTPQSPSATTPAVRAAEKVVDDIDFNGPSSYSLRQQKVEHFASLIDVEFAEVMDVLREARKSALITRYARIPNSS